jgi:hypothetical protein
MAPPAYHSRGAWRFRNVTRAFGFWPTLESVAIAAEHPDMVSAFTCRVVDADSTLAFAVEDEVVVTFRGERVWAGHLKSVGQDQLSEVGPRAWDLAGQDYTAKLDDAVVRRRAKRKKESARRRIRWLVRCLERRVWALAGPRATLQLRWTADGTNGPCHTGGTPQCYAPPDAAKASPSRACEGPGPTTTQQPTGPSAGTVLPPGAMVEGGHVMGIKLSFEIVSPLEPTDRELLTGVSIMTLAIANHELAKERFPETFPDEEESAPAPDDGPEPLPCGATNGHDGSCISEVGHRGRHRFRTVSIDLRPRPAGTLH